MLDQMKKVNAEIEDLEAKRAAEEDETKAQVIAEMIEAKTAEFAQLEAKYQKEQEKQAREKKLADIAAKQAEMNEIERAAIPYNLKSAGLKQVQRLKHIQL